MKINRRFTKAGVDVFSTVKWDQRTSRISHTDGTVVFEMKDAEIPADWSQLATDIVVSKYFRKAGIPQVDASGAPILDEKGQPKTGPEKSVKQVVHRLAGCWTQWGKEYGYFNTDEDAQAFYDELAYMLLHQVAAPNSPQWFNTGLNFAYGLTGPSQGHWHVNPASGQLEQTKDAYTHPQPHACQPYHARVSTPSGPIKIGVIVQDHLIGLEVFDGTDDGSGRTRILAVKENGKKLVYKLSLRSGMTVEATNDHLVLCVPLDADSEVAQWREIRDLRVGDRLFQRVTTSRPPETSDSTKLARFSIEMIETARAKSTQVRQRNEVDSFMQLVEIAEISEVGIQNVYDIQTQSGQYLSNDIIVHNCFIQGVNDDLVNDGGIMDLWTREARLFKYGSGTGTNFSKVRGENESLSGGGKSSGLMSFLKIGDRAAGAIKSGGTTRRAAKMVCLELDHPDIEEFVNWKVREEIKVACLVEGIKHLPKEQQELAKKMKLKLDYDFNGEAYATVSGQNSNNSIRVPNKFLKAVEHDSDWQTIKRTNGKVHKTLKARELWKQIGYAAWRCADPGVQYDDTINEWHTCPQSGRINASNPCSEYMFLDNTACNLASVNLMKLFNETTREFDIEGFRHACRLWTVVLEISVLMAAYPSREIARLSYEYRTLGLGYANIGTMLMVSGIPYDSDAGRAVCGAVSAMMTGESYATSAEMAKEQGPFPGFRKNRNDMLRVMRNHRAAAYNNEAGYEGLTVRPVAIDGSRFGEKFPMSVALLGAARECWDRALALGEQYGYRNAQTTVIAPTGTIGLLMDCDTTGVEPDFALVKFKKLAGGGYFKIANQSVEPALHNLGYTDEQVREILTYVMGTLSLKGAPHINQEVLKAKGFTDEELAKTEACLPSVFELAFAFSPWSLGEGCMQRLGIARETWQNPSFNLLKTLGFSKKAIREANEFICGTQTIEGAPHLREEHYPVFDCANRCGRKGKRFIHYMGHVKMMAAAQPFISGAISKTINMPNEVSVGDIEEAYMESWKLSLKAVALYRDGSKLSQPLNSQSDEEGEEAEATEKPEARSQKPEVSVQKLEAPVAGGRIAEPVEKVIVKIVERPLRRRLPDTRASVTHKFDIAGHEGYITVGLFEDNTPGEVFITMAKQGSTIGGLMDTIATLISLNLQYGVPVDAIVRKFEHMRFEPAGMTMNQDIPFAKSFIDYVVRWMGMQFIPGYRAANAPKREGQMNTIEPATAITPETGNGSGMADSPPHSQIPHGVGREAVREAVGHGGPSPAGNGHSHGNGENGGGGMTLVASRTELLMQGGSESALNLAMRGMMGDAPTCTCGSITVRNGTCYKCLNCGASLGCS